MKSDLLFFSATSLKSGKNTRPSALPFQLCLCAEIYPLRNVEIFSFDAPVSKFHLLPEMFIFLSAHVSCGVMYSVLHPHIRTG